MGTPASAMRGIVMQPMIGTQMTSAQVNIFFRLRQHMFLELK